MNLVLLGLLMIALFYAPQIVFGALAIGAIGALVWLLLTYRNRPPYE